jgi:hypothetical protein
MNHVPASKNDIAPVGPHSGVRRFGANVGRISGNFQRLNVSGISVWRLVRAIEWPAAEGMFLSFSI